MTGAGEAIAAFLDFMEGHGVSPAEPIADRLGSGLIRFRCEGDGMGKRNGWATLFLDGVPAGRFGNYRLGIDRTWRAKRVEQLAPEQLQERRRAIQDARARREAEKQARQEEAAAQATVLWDGGSAVDPAHPYLVRKRISGEGLRQHGRALLVPMRDVSGRLSNVQRIYPDGFKSFLKGGRIEGLFWLCGEPDAVVCIGEGMGTVAAVRRATGHAVAASITGANLETVARALHALWPDADKIILADDDRALVNHPRIKRNLGLDYAKAAAAAVGGRLAVPAGE